MRWDSLRFRMSVLYSLVLGVILTIVVGIVIYQVHRILYRGFDDKLKIKAVKVANMFNTLYRIETGEQGYLRLGPYRLPVVRTEVSEQTQILLKGMWKSEAESLNLGSDYIQIYNGQGQLLNQSENVSDEIAKDWEKGHIIKTDRVTYQNIRLHGKSFRWIYYPFDGPAGQTYFVKLAGSLGNIHRFLKELLGLAIGTIIVVLLVTSFLGWLLTQRVLKPVNAVVDTARKISYKDLHLRIPPEGADQEIQYLIESFNAMIERLENSFEHINDFSSHVAHELKTPLAIIRGEMELALQQPRDSQEYQRVIHVSLEEMDRLIRLIRDLLFLARLDYQPDMFKFHKIDLVPMLQDLADQARIMAESQGLSLKVVLPDAPLNVNADADQMRRLFLNLIDNAIKYTGSGGEVQLSAAADDVNARITVSDTGRGIPAEHLPRIFEKFHRVHNHSDRVAGTGLGLSIALSIAKAHQGDILVDSEPSKGSTFTIVLPRA